MARPRRNKHGVTVPGLFLCFALAACTGEGRSTAEPTPPARPSAVHSETRVDALTRPPATPFKIGAAQDSETSCGALLKQFKRIRAGERQGCQRKGDCGCHPLLPFDNHIAAADHRTAARLQEIANAYHRARCPLISVQVATPPVCAPKCAARRCELP